MFNAARFIVSPFGANREIDCEKKEKEKKRKMSRKTGDFPRNAAFTTMQQREVK